jgi:hypothetical protein
MFSLTHPTYWNFLEGQCNKGMYSDRTSNFLLNKNISPVESVVEKGVLQLSIWNYYSG